MTSAKLAKLVGKNGVARLVAGSTTLQVEVEIRDARSAFGRLDVLVRPIAGEGEAWVSLDSVTVDEEEEV